MPDRPAEIGIEQHGIARVLSTYWLRVPPNQREYSWTKPKTERLFQDLKGALNRNRYFLGTIVTVPMEGQGGRLEVVDGQQRLATTAILLAAIREYALQHNPKIAEGLTNKLSDIDMDEEIRLPRLRLNVDDNEFFQPTILRLNEEEPLEPRLDSHRLLKVAKSLAREHVQSIVAGLHPSQHGAVLKEWVNFLDHHATVILLKVPDRRDAFKMFETLNDRGLQTSQADLIKSYVFGQASSGGRIGEAQAKWSSMRGSLESLSEKEVVLTFLRHAAIAEFGFVREDELFDTVEAQVTGSLAAVRFADNLDAASTDYVAIQTPEHDKWNSYSQSIRKSVQALELLSVRPMRPLLLAIARRFPPGQAAKAFEAMVAWKVRIRVAGNPRSEATERPLAETARDVTRGDIASYAELYERLNKIVPADSQFADAFTIARVTTAALARYYLRSLESTVNGDPEPWLIPNDDATQINLEHVLPLKPMGNWPEFSPDEARTYCHYLGNQVLLRYSDNSAGKSAPFSEKRPVLAKSLLKLTSHVADKPVWDRDSILERGKRLAEIAVKTWPLPTR